MKQTQKQRWTEPAFVQSLAPVLSKITAGSAVLSGIDIAGISIGSGPVEALRNANLYKARIESVDLSDSELSGSMNEVEMKNTRFLRASLDRCLIRNAHVADCDFSSAKLIVSLDDSVFERCVFHSAVFAGGKAGAEYGGRRVKFIHCDFGGASFKSIEFRATQFIDCNLSNVKFVGCDLRGTKVTGGQVPNARQFEKMDPPAWAQN